MPRSGQTVKYDQNSSAADQKVSSAGPVPKDEVRLVIGKLKYARRNTDVTAAAAAAQSEI